MDGEKRQGARSYAVADVTYENKGMRFQGRINDLSPGGMYIDTINPLPEASPVTFRFDLPGDEPENPVSGEGEVVWMVHMQGMGIRFTRLSDEDRARLEAYLSRG
ncbi:MAG: PilZ domain-containing protein [Candidatus Aminicenantes bacterium]|nr:PilZ domain-containing protein [Candidatus Aminicenantes bacterium]NLH78053.1 hypothetical protein [Acidobacteriota bacterium]